MKTTKKIKITGDVNKQMLNNLMRYNYTSYKGFRVCQKETDKTITLTISLRDGLPHPDNTKGYWPLNYYNNVDGFLQDYFLLNI